MSPRARAALVLLAPALAAAFSLARESARAQEPAPAPARPLSDLSRSLAGAVERAAPSLVAIRSGGEGERSRRSARSGVIVAPGLVATYARHVEVFGLDGLVIEDAEGREHSARLRGRDLRTRIVLLAAPTLEPAGLPPAAPERARRSGAFVLALGTPLRRRGTPTATLGVLSARGRFQGRADQVDAPLDRSNLGGAVVDLEGRLLGVSVQVSERFGERSGVGFYVPLALIRAVLPELEAGRQLEPGALGLHIPKVQSGGEGGVEVISATGPAAKVGLQRGDRILSLAGRPTPDLVAFRRAVAYLYAGQQVRLRYRRAGAERELELELAPRAR